MDSSKLTARAASRLRDARAGDLLDVVVELVPPSATAFKGALSGRAARIAMLKNAFDEEVEPVVSAIHSLGGEVLGTAWINHTVRGRVPVEGMNRLSELDAVMAVDAPRMIEADTANKSRGLST